jgi:hypothetical protein
MQVKRVMDLLVCNFPAPRSFRVRARAAAAFNTPQALPGNIFPQGRVEMKDGLPGIRRNRGCPVSAVY